MAEPYQDPSNTTDNRVEDLLARLTVEDKAGLMFHDIITMGPGGQFISSDNPFGRPATEAAIRDMRLNHFNLAGQVDDVRELVAWHNRVQELALATGPGIPVTLSTDPRHAFSNNPGTEALAGVFSQWPQSLGFAALGDAELVQRYADIARQEYLAAGIRVALHPQIDLATEPRWARIGMTFGEDADLTSRLVAAYIRGFQGTELGQGSVATMTKHFPGGGPQMDGEDPHFAYGREQVYPGGQMEYHLKPFRAAIAAGTSQMMPYYGMPVGTDWEEVGFAFSHGVITELLRNKLGFEGIVCTDWGLISDSVIMGQPMPARAWGAEHLSELDRVQKIIDAGCDQFGGESRPELVVELVRYGRVTEERIDQSVRRILREKFVLGLFEQPFLDVDRAVTTIGRPDFVAEGEAAQRAAIVRLTAADSGPAALPVGTDQAVYIENIGSAAAARLGRVVDDPADADLAVLRLKAPYEPRPGGFESFFHAGSLEFPTAERDRIVAVCEQLPTIIVLFLDRPAIVPELAAAAAALLVEFGAQDEAVVDVLLGKAQARGRLPFDLPSSTKAVTESRSDVPYDTADPVFRFGDGIQPEAGTKGKKYQAKAPSTQAFGEAAFEASDGTTLRWLGMAGFLINSRGTTLMVDPLLGGFDMPIMIELPIAAEDVPRLDAILVTHSDNDHYSIPTCRDLAGVTRAYHSTKYVASLMEYEGLPAYGHDIGDDFNVGGVRVEVTPADHAWQNATPGASTRTFQPEDACGFWIETADGTIWAPGDSRLIPEHHLQMPAADAMLFDFSDSEWHFGLAGAVRMANAYPSTPLLLYHWGSVDAPDFAPFNGDPESLYGLVNNPERIHVIAPGEPFTLNRLTR